MLIVNIDVLVRFNYFHQPDYLLPCIAKKKKKKIKKLAKAL